MSSGSVKRTCLVMGLGKRGERERGNRDEGVCGQSEKGAKNMNVAISGAFSNASSRNV